MHVSNIPDTPEPILVISPMAVICPVNVIITIPETIPVIRTRKTLNPAIPPINTSR